MPANVPAIDAPVALAPTSVPGTTAPATPQRPLRVCIVAIEGPRTTGGLATYARNLADCLADEHEVTYVSRFDRALPRELNHGEAGPRQSTRAGKYALRTIAPPRPYRPVLRRLLSLICHEPLRRLGLAVYRRAFVPELRRAIPEAVDVVHFIGTGWDLLGFAAAQVARERGAALTVWPAVHPQMWGDGPLDITFYNQADAIFAQSDFERQHLAARGVDLGHVHVCRLAPNIAAEGDGRRFRSRHGLGERPILLFVGAKTAAKGFPALRDAMPLVLRAVPDCCLVAIGPGTSPDGPALPAGAMLDLGVAPEAEKLDALAACDAFCMPSAGESFGIVYTEAWAYGKPVIVGPAPASRELVADGVTGLHASQAPADIAGAAIRLLTDRPFAARLGAAGRAFQQATLTWASVRARHLDVFHSLRSRGSSGGAQTAAPGRRSIQPTAGASAI